MAKKITINAKRPRLIGRILEIENPQNVAHHLSQLEKKGFISIDEKTGKVFVKKYETGPAHGLLKLPIFGTANCGPATLFAEQNLQGFLAVPPENIGRAKREGLFVIKAVGDSLNAAKGIIGGPVKSGDYVVIDKDNVSPMNGQYVLSILDNMANIKRFYRDTKNHQIRLESESTIETKPIYIREEDFQDYMVNGVVMGVIKKQK
ncbi:MAG: hypothetical protein FJZ43_03560 [Candidatus Staskawiczbacteria bacterium]|nr:hypothetical protein [Candidatus Staskawiczbacteria bacterium]